MVEIVKSGGWLMVPIILSAIIAMGIILERFWTLRQKRVIPEDLTSKVWGWVKKDQLDQKQIQILHQGSALGQILAAGLINRDRTGGRRALVLSTATSGAIGLTMCADLGVESITRYRVENRRIWHE